MVDLKDLQTGHDQLLDTLTDQYAAVSDAKHLPVAERDRQLAEIDTQAAEWGHRFSATSEQYLADHDPYAYDYALFFLQKGSAPQDTAKAVKPIMQSVIKSRIESLANQASLPGFEVEFDKEGRVTAKMSAADAKLYHDVFRARWPVIEDAFRQRDEAQVKAPMPTEPDVVPRNDLKFHLLGETSHLSLAQREAHEKYRAELKAALNAGFLAGEILTPHWAKWEGENNAYDFPSIAGKGREDYDMARAHRKKFGPPLKLADSQLAL
jgi:hypothetical protein